MENRHSTICPCVSIVLSPASRQSNSNDTCVYVGIDSWSATRHKLYSSVRASLCKFVSTFNTVILTIFELIAVLTVMIVTGLEWQRKIFCFVGNILRMLRLIRDAPNSKWTARFSKIPNHTRTCKLPMRMNRGTIPSTLMPLRVAAHICRALKGVMDFLRTGSKRSFFIWVAPERVLSKHALVKVPFELTPIERFRCDMKACQKGVHILETIVELHAKNVRSGWWWESHLWFRHRVFLDLGVGLFRDDCETTPLHMDKCRWVALHQFRYDTTS